MISRRQFVQSCVAGAAGFAAGSAAFTARSYAQIIGSNERVNFGVIGLHSRAYAHLASLKANQATSRITHVCDVDSRYLDKYVADTNKAVGYAPAADRDFRKLLASKDVDAITIATPEHWHAPMAIAGLQAGKHVYVEKPCSFNPAEGEMLVAAQRKYGKLVQMGNQQRSSAHTIEIVGRIHGGLIGTAYLGKAWYANKRDTMGIGKVVPVPATLDWELWQGPAPRRAYKDNIHPYNWHWIRHYGTGETLNNGTHEVDVCRWALGVEYPKTVSASGGRYAFKDDWEFYDTLDASWTYDGKMISWDDRSCNPAKTFGRDRGAQIVGTNGSVIVDRDGYEVYDFSGKKTSEFKVGSKTSSADLTGADTMTDAHFANLIAGIQQGEKLHSPVVEGNVAVTMLQLANIAWETGRTLELNPANGRIVNDPRALAMTEREYEKGWAPKV